MMIKKYDGGGYRTTIIEFDTILDLDTMSIETKTLIDTV